MKAQTHIHGQGKGHHQGLHGHSHAPPAGNIAAAFFLNTAFAVIERIGGLLTNSVAILSDAVHDFGDSLSLGAAWYFQKKSIKGRSNSYTYGYGRFSLAGAFVSSTVLLVGSILIIQEAAGRLFHPEPANYGGMIGLALLGIAVNGAALLRLKKGSSINERVVSLHFLEDVLGWVAVLAGAVVMLFVYAPVIDPILSLGIACFILFNVYRNIRPAFRIMLQGAPDGLSEAALVEAVLQTEEVVSIHDFRIWTLDGSHHVASMHVVVRRNMDLKTAEHLKERVKQRLKEWHIT